MSMMDTSAQAEDHRFPCPSCGSDLRFAPGTELMRCDHCGTEVPIQSSRSGISELDLRRALNDRTTLQADMEVTRVSNCESCGAQVEFDADLHARECPFCASPLVTDTGLHRHIKPQAQLPFLLTQDEARQAMRKWLGSLWFAPSNLKKYAQSNRPMSGIYVPYWTYDAETRSQYTGQRGTVYYETRSVPVTVNGKREMRTQQVAKVKWRNVRGRVARNFDDVLVLGSRSLPKRFTDALAPWDLSALSRYEPQYLAGFRAEGYGVDVSDGYSEAQQIMNGVIESDVRQDIGGDRQRINSLDTDVGALSFKHILLPVWLAAYKYRGKTFRFVVNGRTGSVEGERPYSAIKIALAVLVGILIAMGLAYLQATQ